MELVTNGPSFFNVKVFNRAAISLIIVIVSSQLYNILCAFMVGIYDCIS